MNITVSILDNNKDHLDMMRLALEDEFKLFATHDTNLFIDSIKQPAVIVIDWFLDYGIIGNTVVRRVRVKNPLCHVIYVSSIASKETLLEVINEGWGAFFIEKDTTNFFKDLTEKINAAKDLLRIKIAVANNEAKKDELLKEQINKTLQTLERQ